MISRHLWRIDLRCVLIGLKKAAHLLAQSSLRAQEAAARSAALSESTLQIVALGIAERAHGYLGGLACISRLSFGQATETQAGCRRVARAEDGSLSHCPCSSSVIKRQGKLSSLSFG